MNNKIVHEDRVNQANMQIDPIEGGKQVLMAKLFSYSPNPMSLTSGINTTFADFFIAIHL
jgi:hypothetical protein